MSTNRLRFMRECWAHSIDDIRRAECSRPLIIGNDCILCRLTKQVSAIPLVGQSRTNAGVASLCVCVCLFVFPSSQVLAIFKDLKVKKSLYYLVFGESLLNGMIVYERGRGVTRCIAAQMPSFWSYIASCSP